jgi:hypothetical protein
MQCSWLDGEGMGWGKGTKEMGKVVSVEGENVWVSEPWVGGNIYALSARASGG